MLAAAFAAFHPNPGIVKDAVFYVGQALSHLNPAIRQHDLFFAFGSQDDYTLWSRLHAPLIEALGLEAANMTLLAVCQAAWLVALVVLLQGLTRGPLLWLVAALLVVLPRPYGSTFTVGEDVLTARLPAEAAAMAALACLLRGRLWLSAMGGMAALALHPLMALPAMALAGVYLALGDRRWRYALGAAGIATVAAAAAGLEPAARLFRTYDPEWFDIVWQRNSYVFPTTWPAAAWGRLAFDLAAVAGACLVLRGRRRQLMLAALVTALGGLGAALVGGDLLGNVLVTQLQPWRTGWLLHMLAVPAVVFVAVRLRHCRPDGPAILALYVAGWAGAVLPVVGPVFSGLALLFTWARVRPAAGRRQQPLAGWARLTCLAAAALVLLGWGGVHIAATVVGWPLREIRDAAAAGLLVHHPIAVAVWAVLLGWLLTRLRRAPAAHAIAALAAALPALGLAAMHWDGRTGWLRQIESPPASVAAVRSEIPLGATVYWPDGAIAVWLLLDRPAHVSTAQGAGVLFNRQTAMAFRDRIAGVAPIGAMDRLAWADADHACDRVRPQPGAEALRAVCTGPGGPDFVVLPAPVAGLDAVPWRAPAPLQQACLADGALRIATLQDFHLYRCDALSSAGDGEGRGAAGTD